MPSRSLDLRQHLIEVIGLSNLHRRERASSHFHACIFAFSWLIELRGLSRAQLPDGSRSHRRFVRSDLGSYTKTGEAFH
jgi:hypothetical protein